MVLLQSEQIRADQPRHELEQFFSLGKDAAPDSRSPNQQLLPLTAQVNPQQHLEIGGCDVVELVQKFGSPLYILDETTFRVACQHYRQALQHYYAGPSLAIYASKAWNCLATCALAASEGLGIDVASGGELYTALQAGVNPALIYFHGNNKSPLELEQALAAGITVVADNWLELERLVELAPSTNTAPRVMLRMTPGIECHTHEYIRTGHLDSKFGFDPNQIGQLIHFAQQHPQINWVGLHAHIGSQIFELEPHQDLPAILVDWFVQAQAAGLEMSELNVGGGLGVRYVETDNPPAIAEWVEVVAQHLTAACQSRQLPLPKLICEPGRSIVAPAGITAYTIGGRKQVPEIRTYLSIDGGMSDNPRPITYQSQYRALLANNVTAPLSETVTVAGKHCESGDILLKEISLPATQPGDVLTVLVTGAYNYSMASNYNRLPRPAAILVSQGEANLIVQRETYADLIRQDVLPQRLSESG
jgi:diaminopimelate decarboxylase